MKKLIAAMASIALIASPVAAGTNKQDTSVALIAAIAASGVLVALLLSGKDEDKPVSP